MKQKGKIFSFAYPGRRLVGPPGLRQTPPGSQSTPPLRGERGQGMSVCVGVTFAIIKGQIGLF